MSPISATAITGFGLIIDSSGAFSKSALVVGKVYAADYAPPTPTMMTTAVSDMQTAYTDAAGRTDPTATELGAGDIGGMTLAPGLYRWSTDVTIPTDVTLSGGPSDVWIFQVSQNLIVSSAVHVILSGGAQAANVFWQVAGQTTLGTNATFNGNILDQTAVVLNTGAILNGRALAQTAVTLDANSVTVPVLVSPIVTKTLTVSVSGLNASDTAEIAVQDLTASTTVGTSTGNGSSVFVLNENDAYAATATTTAQNYSVATSAACAGTLSANELCDVTFTFTLASTTTPTSADIAVMKTVDNANPADGATVNYTIAVTANGPATSTDVAAEDILPTGLTFLSATTSFGSFASSTGIWTIGDMSASSTEALHISAQVNASSGIMIPNTATVAESPSLTDPNLANNSSTVAITVQSTQINPCALSASDFQTDSQDGRRHCKWHFNRWQYGVVHPDKSQRLYRADQLFGI